MDGLHINSGSVLINTKRHGQRNKLKGNDLPNSGSFECSKQSILSSMDKFVRTVQGMRNTILVPSRLRDMNLRQRLPDCQISTLIENSSNGNKMMKNNKNSNSTTKHNYQSSSNSHYHSHHSYHLLHRNLLQDYHLGYSHYNTQSLTNSSTSLQNDFNNRLNYDPAEIPSALMNADLFNFYSMLYDVKQQLLWGPASGQSTIFTNYSTNTDLNQLNSTMANCNLNNSDNQTTLNHSIKHSNRAESTCSSGYSSNSSTRNSTTNLSFIAQSPTTTPANTIQQHLIQQSTNSSTNSLSTPLQLRSVVTNQDDVKLTMNLNNNQLNDSTSSTVCSDSSTISTDSTDGKLVNVVDSPQSKTPQSDSDLESELGSDSILTDRTSSEQITDQTQLLASAFRHHLQALHTILDQLTHSAEYLSRNYELDLDESTN